MTHADALAILKALHTIEFMLGIIFGFLVTHAVARAMRRSS